jgi:hypothetical protein
MASIEKKKFWQKNQERSAKRQHLDQSRVAKIL